MTQDDLANFCRNIETAVVQAPNDLANGSGTIYLKLHEFEEANGKGWRLQRAPLVLEDGSLLAILIRLDPDLAHTS